MRPQPDAGDSSSTLNANLSCSFCGKPRAEVRTLVQGLQSFICDECIHLSAAIVLESRKLRADSQPSEARCAVHESERMSFVCVRCGTFGCAACAPIDHRAEGVCANCRVRVATPQRQSRAGTLVLGMLLGVAAIVGTFVLAAVVAH